MARDELAAARRRVEAAGEHIEHWEARRAEAEEQVRHLERLGPQPKCENDSVYTTGCPHRAKWYVHLPGGSVVKCCTMHMPSALDLALDDPTNPQRVVVQRWPDVTS